MRFAVSVFMAAICAAVSASADVLVSRTTWKEGTYGYGYGECDLGTGDGNSAWLTSELNRTTGGHVTVVDNLDDAAQVSAADALWIDTRNSKSGSPIGHLSATEKANIAAFIATGKRVVMFGENSNWEPWNTDLLDIVGGSYTGETYVGPVVPAFTHALTAGVTQVQFRVSGLASGGQSLFAQPIVTLWGPQSNVLVHLDASEFADFFMTAPATYQDRQFVTNIAEWVATPVPEPACGALLLGAGLIAALAIVRMKRSERVACN